MTIFGRITASSISETTRSALRHYDYFGYIIPSTYFIVSIALIDIWLYPKDNYWYGVAILLKKYAFDTTLNTGFTFLFGIIALILLFNIIYTLGHFLNGISALVLDRSVTRKLLHYPSEIYHLYASRNGPSSSHDAFHSLVSSASYSVLSLNLIPVIVGELAIVGYCARDLHRTPRWILVNALSTEALLLAIYLILLVLSILHLGFPLTPRRRIGSGKGKRFLAVSIRAAFIHSTFVFVLPALVEWLIITHLDLWYILIFPGINILVITMERIRKSDGDNAVVTLTIRLLRARFVNLFYWFANIAGYGDAPAKDVIDSVEQEIGQNIGTCPSEYYWACSIAAEKAAGHSYNTAYHFLSMYGMNRNLANATNVTILYSVVRIFLKQPAHEPAEILIMLSILLAFSIAFFIRYLYLYGAYYSKYLFRHAFFVMRPAGEGANTVALSGGEGPE